MKYKLPRKRTLLCYDLVDTVQVDWDFFPERFFFFYIISFLRYNLPYSYSKSNIKVFKLYQLSSFNTNKNNCIWQTGCLLSSSPLEFHLTGAHASHFLLALVNVNSNKLNTQSQTFKRCHIFCLL